MTTIQVIPTTVGRNLTEADVIAECRAAQGHREIDDQTARVIASFYASPGSIGHILGGLATGAVVDREELLEDISATISRHYAQGDADGRLMLDMLGTWALNFGRFDVVDLRLCSDCAAIVANGTLGAEDELEDSAHAARMSAHLGDDVRHLVNGDSDDVDDFSATPCGACGTTDAGSRHAGALLLPKF